MKMPLSWLKDFVDIKMSFTELARKLSAAGLTVETWENEGTDVIFDPEVTSNRPDWLSVYGVAREIAAVTSTNLQDPRSKIQSNNQKIKPEILIKNNFELCPRYTAILVKNVRVKPSSESIQKRLKQVGLRPINNLVDISNYVMWEFGNPLHVFDYDKIRGHQMVLEETKGGEPFRSLDGIDYKLPKGAIIIKDVGRIIDLCGIKGGENTAVSTETKNVLIHVPIYELAHIRRTSQALGLRSDASAIFERGADPGGTLKSLARAAELIGGEIASEIIDLKKQEFNPWKVSLRHERLEKVLGITISPLKVKDILERLELKVDGQYKVTVPTFRNDIHIEEDLIEEVGRIYGYDNFPKTLPASAVPTVPVAYAKDYDFEYQVKSIIKGAGYSEIYTYSLVPEKQLIDMGINPDKVLRVDNPISRDYEYLRPHLLGNLLEALKLNQANFENIKLFELGKCYVGKTIDEAKEQYWIDSIISGERFFEAKGDVESLLESLGIEAKFLPFDEPNSFFHPGRSAQIIVDKTVIGNMGELHPAILSRFGIKGHVARWALYYDLLLKTACSERIYKPVPKYPAVIEDISISLPKKALVGDVIAAIKKTSGLVNSVELIDVHGETKTFRVTFLDPTKNLTDQGVAKIRAKIQMMKLGVSPKER